MPSGLERGLRGYPFCVMAGLVPPAGPKPLRRGEGPLIGLARSKDPGEIEYTRPGEIIRCPWHGWEFDVRTGQSYCDPRRFRVKTYPAQVEAGASVVKGPYVAETIKVAVESDYVVVEL